MLCRWIIYSSRYSANTSQQRLTIDRFFIQYNHYHYDDDDNDDDDDDDDDDVMMIIMVGFCHSIFPPLIMSLLTIRMKSKLLPTKMWSQFCFNKSTQKLRILSCKFSDFWNNTICQLPDYFNHLSLLTTIICKLAIKPIYSIFLSGENFFPSQLQYKSESSY